MNAAHHNNYSILRLGLALLVALGHFKLLQGVGAPQHVFSFASIAVEAFFVVSGVLVAQSWSRSSGLVSFYARRLFRIAPLYIVVVLLQAVGMALFFWDDLGAIAHDMARYLVANLLFLNFLQHDVGGLLAGAENPGINPSLWTLKIELGFYLILPAILWAFRRWGAAVLVLIFAASSLYHLALVETSPLLAKQLPGQLRFFAVGVALAVYGPRLRCSPWTGLAVVLVSGALAANLGWIAGGLAQPIFLGAFVFFFAERIWAAPIQRDLSYGVYLAHGPIIQFALLLGLIDLGLPSLIGVVAAALLAAWIGWTLVEAPAIALGRGVARELTARLGGGRAGVRHV